MLLTLFTTMLTHLLTFLISMPQDFLINFTVTYNFGHFYSLQICHIKYLKEIMGVSCLLKAWIFV